MTTFTKDDLVKGKQVCEKATPEPWWYGRAKGTTGDMGIAAAGDANIIVECFAEFHAKGDMRPEQAQANADFIAHARKNYPLALGALEEAWAEVDILRRQWDSFTEVYGSAIAFDIALRAAEEG